MTHLAFALSLSFYAAAFLFTFHEADEDLWGRMAAGRLTMSEGRVPEKDVFAYVPTKPLWVDHEWLSGAVFYEVHRAWGGTGLLALRGALCFRSWPYGRPFTADSSSVRSSSSATASTASRPPASPRAFSTHMESST